MRRPPPGYLGEVWGANLRMVSSWRRGVVPRGPPSSAFGVQVGRERREGIEPLILTRFYDPLRVGGYVQSSGNEIISVLHVSNLDIGLHFQFCLMFHICIRISLIPCFEP